MAEWPWRHRSRSKVVTRDTSFHARGHLCQIGKEYIQNWICCRTDLIRCAIFLQFYWKVMAELPWRYRSRSKVIANDTPSHASGHLCLVWKESIQNCKSYGADTECEMYGWTDGRRDGVKPISSPTTSLYTNVKLCSSYPVVEWVKDRAWLMSL